MLNIKLIKIIKKGLTNSIGWNLGKIIKSIHLFALFTSAPIMGTRNSEANDNIKIIGEILKSFPSLIEDKTKIIDIPKITNDRCLKKNA